MNAIIKAIPLLALGIVLSGCEKSEPAASSATAAPTPPPQAAQPVATVAAPVAKVDLPTTLDYEKKAQTEITAQNMGKELDEIEKQLP